MMYQIDKDELFKWLSIFLLITTGVVVLMIYFYQHQEYFYVVKIIESAREVN